MCQGIEMHCVSSTTYLIFKLIYVVLCVFFSVCRWCRRKRAKEKNYQKNRCIACRSADGLRNLLMNLLFFFGVSHFGVFFFALPHSPFADHYNFCCNNKPQNEFKSGWHLKHNCTFVPATNTKCHGVEARLKCGCHKVIRLLGRQKRHGWGREKKKRLIATFSIVHHKSWVDSGETMHLATEHCTSVAAC